MARGRPACRSQRHWPALQAGKPCPACDWTPAREQQLQQEEADELVRRIMIENRQKRVNDLLRKK